ncbi:hypothetical protein C8R43DRAFT_935017 [Mycena crocata]|nr:hypothetical protein C8R43DRAFT_935017 [Mycena crocata]
MSTLRTILVTGSNQGLGMHTVHRLASTPNVLVFMASRKLAAAEESLSKFASDVHPSSTVVPVQLELTDEGSIKAAHSKILEHLQARDVAGLDVLINNAAVLIPEFKETYAVNVLGTVAVTETFRPLINPGGVIINISSSIGSFSLLLSTDMISLPAYSSSKSALNNLTIQWALQEKKKGSGIRVVAVCPGYISTNLNNFTGTISPADGCMFIVEEALKAEGRTAVFFTRDGDLGW